MGGATKIPIKGLLAFGGTPQEGGSLFDARWRSENPGLMEVLSTALVVL